MEILLALFGVVAVFWLIGKLFSALIWLAGRLLSALFSLLGFIVRHFYILIILFLIPGFIDEAAVLVVLFIVAVINSLSDSGGGYSGDYVLNRNTGVIRDRWDPTVSDVDEHNRRYISSSKAWDLVGRGKKYRFKK